MGYKSSNGVVILMPLGRHANMDQLSGAVYLPSPSPICWDWTVLFKGHDEDVKSGFVIRAADRIAENFAQYL